MPNFGPVYTYEAIASSSSRAEHLHCPSITTLQTSKQALSCSDCKVKSFNRPSDKSRHNIANHLCHFKLCQEWFVDKAALQRHVNEQHPERPWRLKCGSCSFSDTREDKIRQHLRNIHRATLDTYSQFQCRKAPCWSVEIYGGIFFPSILALNNHNTECHQGCQIDEVQLIQVPGKSFFKWRRGFF